MVACLMMRIVIIIIIIAPCLTGCSVLGSAPLHEFVSKTFTSTARFLGRRPWKRKHVMDNMARTKRLP